MNIARHFKRLLFPVSLFCWTTIFIGVGTYPSKGQLWKQIITQPARPLVLLNIGSVSGTITAANYPDVFYDNILCQDIPVKLTKTTFPSAPIPYTFGSGNTIDLGDVKATGTYLSNGCNYSIVYDKNDDLSPYGTPYLEVTANTGNWYGGSLTFGVDQLPNNVDFMIGFRNIR